MKTTLSIALVILCFGSSLSDASGQRTRKNIASEMQIFWSTFQAAVARNDKEAVASMTHFPLEMPYGVRSIRTKAQFMKSYSKIFDAETKKCFSTATPNPERGKTKRFWIGCGEAMMYWFNMVNGEYKFISVDNVNE
ncbi:MAG: hypothetical protein WCB68_10745 [Pyrinomonadaceae bacterium]